LYVSTQEAPSTAVRNLSTKDISPSAHEDLDTWLMRQLLTRHNDSLTSVGASNALFSSLAALLELHLSTPSRNMPFFTGSGETLILRYYDRSTGNREGLQVDTRILWPDLRTEVDEQRSTLLWMPRFVQQHFDLEHAGMNSAYKDLEERFKLHFQEMELAEIRLRDHIGMQSSQRSTEMVEQSIRESMRVMLRNYRSSITLMAIRFLLQHSDSSRVRLHTRIARIFDLRHGMYFVKSRMIIVYG
jgi:hypothetical protein